MHQKWILAVKEKDFTFKGLKPGKVQGVGQLTVNSPETEINVFDIC